MTSSRAAADVVPHGVVDEVGDQALGQPRVAGDGGRGERGAHADATPLRLAARWRSTTLRVMSARSTRSRLLDALLAAGQGEQRVDRGAPAAAPRASTSWQADAQRVGGRVGVGEGDLEQGPFHGQRGAQLVGGVGDELPLRRRTTPRSRCEQAVEGVGELGELVVGGRQAEPPVQVAGGDVRGRWR